MSAQLGLGIVGAIVGSFAGMPQLGFMVGSMVGGFIDRAANPIKQEGPRISDLSVSSSAYGNPKPILYGTMRLPGQIIWSTGIKETRVMTKKKSGKGGQTVKTTTYYYSSSVALGLCEGPISGIVRIWMDGKLVYDRDGTGNQTNNQYTLRVYLGDENQLPDGLMQSVGPAHLTPAYRGLAYIMLEDLQLEAFGNRVPAITVEVSNNVNTVNYFLPILLGNTSNSSTTYYDNIRKHFVKWIIPSVEIYTETGAFVKSFNVNNLFPSGHSTPTFINPGMQVVSGGNYYFLAKQGGNEYLYAINPDSVSIVSSGLIGSVGGTYNHSFTGHQSSYDVMGKRNIFIGFEKYPTGEGFGNLVMNATTMTRVSDGFPSPVLGGLVGGISFIPGIVDIDRAVSYGYQISYNSSFGLNNPFYINKITFSSSLASAQPYKTITREMIEAAMGESIVNTTFFLGAVSDVDGSLIIYISSNASPSYVFKYNYDSHQIYWIHKHNGSSGWSRFDKRMSESDLSYGTFGIPSGSGDGYVLNTSTGQVEYTPIGLATNDGWNGFIWSSKEYGGIGFGWNGPSGTPRTVGKVWFNRATSGTVTLKSIVDDLCRRGGLDVATQIDTTTLASVAVKGYIVARPTSAQATLNQLAEAFFMRCVESDGKLKFYLRGTGNSVETIEQKWLGASNSDDTYWKETRKQELELPRRITVTHINPEDDYQQGTQHEQRITNPFPSSWGRNEVSIEFPMVLYPTEAKTIATNVLYSTWAERVEYESILPWKYLHLDPTDLVTINLDSGDVYAVRIQGTTVGADYHIETGFISQDTSVYSPPSNIQGSGSLGFVPQEIVDLTPARIAFLDIPFLVDTDYDSQGYIVYFGAAPYTPGWPGGQLRVSYDNSSSYDDVNSIFGPITNGTASTVLAAPYDPNMTDYINTVNVFLTEEDFDLESISDERFYAGENVALLGKEIIYFKNAVQNIDGSYTLSTLLRGRRGTEWAVGTHYAGEVFYFFELNNYITYRYPVTSIDQSYSYRLVTFGSYESEMPIYMYTFTGASERPYSPAHITSVWSSPNLNINWTRRNRYNGGLRNSVEIPAIEGTNNFDVYILSSPYDVVAEDTKPPTSYVRVYSGLSTFTVNYNNTDRATDGFDVTTDTLHVVVFQHNDNIVGFPGWASFPPP